MGRVHCTDMTLRTLLLPLGIALGLSGCYLAHDAAPTSQPSLDAGCSDAATTEGDAGVEPPPPRVDVPEPWRATCEVECEACSPTHLSDFEVCMEGCHLRLGVAKSNGCDHDFAPWIACIAEQCRRDSPPLWEPCLPLRTCW